MMTIFIFGQTLSGKKSDSDLVNGTELCCGSLRGLDGLIWGLIWNPPVCHLHPLWKDIHCSVCICVDGGGGAVC